MRNHRNPPINPSNPGPHDLKHPRLVFGLAGILSLVWLLARAGFKPSRLQYPCQRAALATLLVSLSYWTGVLGLVAATCAFRRRLARLVADRKGTAAAMAAAFSVCWLMLVSILTAGDRPSPSRAGTTLAVPAWTNPGAISNVFVVRNAPAATSSLDGGGLPPGATEEEAFSDAGMNALVDLMTTHNTPFYRTEATPNGLFAAEDVVVIKINNQWSYGPSQRYNHTRIDLVKGLIYRLVRHPDGFSGAVIVGENTQGVRPDLDTPEYNNAEDPLTSYQDVADAFVGQGYRVATSYWDAFGSYFVDEFSEGNGEDGYVTGAAVGGSGDHELSWPKFTLEIGGATYRISMRYGLWNGSAYEPDRLKMINFPVMKAHGMAGATLALKNYIGFLTISNSDPLFADWDRMHGYFWGYQNRHVGYGLLGRQIAQVRRADLEIIDAIWINPAGNTDDADSCVREDLILAGTDPVALDYYASSRILSQVAFSPADVSAATHGGTFRNFMLCIENRLRAEGITDIIDLSDSMSQAQEEAQFNVFVVDAAEAPPATPTPTELHTATATETPTSASSATPIRTMDIVPDCRVDAQDLMSLIGVGQAEDNFAAVLFDFARCWRVSCGEGP